MEGDVTVRDIMTREYLGVSESDAVADAVDLMLAESAGTVVVLRGTDPVGMLQPEDALAVVADGADPGTTTVDAVMSDTVPTVPPEAPLVEVAGRMADAGVGSLLVTADEDVVGVVDETDVVAATSTAVERRVPEPPGEPADPETVAPAAAVESGEDDASEQVRTQSVCETCGSLTADLREFNGQLICDDCRDI
jgi:CBS domain-containing protein